MSNLKNFLSKLKKPSIAFSIIYVIFSLLIIALTITMIVFGETNSVTAYVMYFVSAIVFSYFVYIIVFFIPKIRNLILNLLKKHKFTNELLESYGYRQVIFTVLSFVFNILFAVFQAVMAILANSIWYGALAAYYVLLSLIRGGIIVISRKKQKETFTLKKQVRAYRNCGIYLVLLNVALTSAIVQMVISNQGFKYAGIMIYVMAAYTFYKLTISVINLFKLKKEKDHTIQSIINISFADSLVSILALQTALLNAFSDGANQLFNALTGGVVSVIIITLGIIMIVLGNKQLKNISKEES